MPFDTAHPNEPDPPTPEDLAIDAITKANHGWQSAADPHEEAAISETDHIAEQAIRDIQVNRPDLALQRCQQAARLEAEYGTLGTAGWTWASAVVAEITKRGSR
jgi:hypothetical protein